MKPFKFRNFTIHQSGNVFRVGTDGVLLGVLCSANHSEKILEVGTGTGLISLMIAQRNPQAEILSLDINEEAEKLAAENFSNSPFKDRMQTVHQDFKDFETGEKFGLIISNPPYFEENPSEKDILARQQTELSFDHLISKTAEFLSETGIFSVIIPFEAGNEFEQKCLKYALFLQKRIKIFGIKNAKAKRCILEFGFEQRNISESEFVIEKSPRKYSDEYLELTQEFHVFGQ
ncbi:methyltransferase [Kaistella sp. DKR-2]|uniref:tRNA1(Val) (adenine(37)-N6)-methyltransferase n=1 Tax=Kaistella soli TaxID=2849654 RepID=UPI001C2626D6|nr:methyltransferase [Kaistella soli]MBU8883926.1 methyltransferase [Kaistella soli]